MDAAVINAVINGQRPDNPFKGINPLEEARLWRLLQLSWHQTVQVRPSMDLVQTVMHSLHLRSEHEGTLVGIACKLTVKLFFITQSQKDGLPQAFAAFVMFGDCTLDEYSEFEYFASYHHGKATAYIFSETAKK